MTGSLPEPDPVERERSELAERVVEGSGVDWNAVEHDSALPDGELAALRWIDSLRAPVGSPPVTPGAHAPAFEVLGELGQGAHGRVVRARDLVLGREVALKQLANARFASPRARELFLAEARALAALDHANIVRIFSVVERDGAIELVLEFVPGETLASLVERAGPRSPAEAARIGIELCRAAAALHARGVVHRDIKPSNVMRAEGGRIVLLDFGIARSADATDGAADSSSGTPRFMAPEQFEGRAAVGPAADLFAIGVLLYWLVSGATPFAGDTYASLALAVLRGDATPLLDRRPDVPPEFARIVERCLAREPAQRWPSAGELERALAAYLAGHAAPRTPSRRRTLAFAAVCTLTAAAVLAWALRPAAPAGLSLDARFVVLRDGRELALAPGDTLRVGDLVSLDVRASEPVHVYVFDADEQGAFFCLFPLAGYELQNPLPPHVTHRLPGRRRGELRSWSVTSAGGAETLVLVAARGARPDLDAQLGRVRAAADEDAMALALDGATRRGVLRGIGATAPAPADAARGEAAALELQHALAELEHADAPDLATRVLRLRSGP